MDAEAIVNYILDKGLNGIGPLTSARDLAREYLDDDGYQDNEERIDALIDWETSKNFTSGFLTGLGGILALPIAVPAGLGASWIVQARMVGAIAVIHGHDLREDRVRTLALLSIVGDAAKEVVKQAGVRVSGKLGLKAVEAIPGRVLIEINKRIGFRLITKAGQKGIVNLVKVVPFLGGLIGGTVDAVALRRVGKAARKIFGKEGRRRRKRAK